MNALIRLHLLATCQDWCVAGFPWPSDINNVFARLSIFMAMKRFFYH